MSLLTTIAKNIKTVARLSLHGVKLLTEIVQVLTKGKDYKGNISELYEEVYTLANSRKEAVDLLNTELSDVSLSLRLQAIKKVALIVRERKDPRIVQLPTSLCMLLTRPLSELATFTEGQLMEMAYDAEMVVTEGIIKKDRNYMTILEVNTLVMALAQAREIPKEQLNLAKFNDKQRKVKNAVLKALVRG